MKPPIDCPLSYRGERICPVSCPCYMEQTCKVVANKKMKKRKECSECSDGETISIGSTLWMKCKHQDGMGTINSVCNLETKKIPKTSFRRQIVMSLDVVICTKDRSHLLMDCANMINQLISYNNFYIFEGSLKPNLRILDSLKDKFNAKIVLVPHLKFGAVRNLIMTTCESDFVAMIDDDIRLEKDWENILIEEFVDKNVVAVSSKLIFEDQIISKLSWANKRISGGSGGAAIYDRKAILRLGNFNKNIHRGEDMELELRIQVAGFKWRKSQKTCAYHPTTVIEFLDRAKSNLAGWDFIMKNSKHRTRFMAKRFVSTFVMPIYYFWMTLDLRCAGIWFIYKMNSLLYYLSGRYKKWS